ncbi:MAG: hypothetical protein AAFU67_17440, partial [Bacteroidota bacterium]
MKYYTLFFCLFTLSQLLAQGGYPVKLIADARDGEIRLRWAPIDQETWLLGVENGYRLERMHADGTQKVILAENIRPFPLNDWEPIGDTLELALMYAGALYSEDFTTTGSLTPDERATIDANRFGLALFSADQFFTIALAGGVGFVDQTISAGSKYVYRLTINGYQVKGGPKSALVHVDTDERKVLPPPASPIAEWTDLSAQIAFDQSLTIADYTSYDIERSANGGPFLKVNEFPLLYIETEENNDPNLYYVDSLLANDIEYTYRVRGRSPFGIVGPASKTVSGSGITPPIPYVPFITDMVQTSDDGIRLEWAIPKEAEGLYSGFKIYRAANALGNWELVTPKALSTNRRTYTDREPKSGWFYTVRLIDINNYEVGGTPRLLVLEDNNPPAPPTGISGSMDSTGVVTLNWLPNAEPDHQGY